MNTYRVDRTSSRCVPCGMNSLLYLGDDPRAARRVFSEAQAGLDMWNQPNAAYGVILSVWNGCDYIVKCEKGLQ